MPAKKQEVKDEAKKTSTNKAKKVTSENGKKVVQKGTSPKAKQTAIGKAEKKEETKKIETKKTEVKKEETRKAEAKKSGTKKSEMGKAEAKKAETKKTEAGKKEKIETVVANATVVPTNKKRVKTDKTSEKPIVAENKKVKKIESSGLAKQIIEEGKELAKRMTIEDNKKNTKDKLKEEEKISESKKNNRNTKSNKNKEEKNIIKDDKKAENESKEEEKSKDIDIKKIGKHSKEIKAREDVEIEEVVAKEIKKNKKIPKEALNKIYTRVFNNIFLAIAVILYLDFVILGFMNIDHNVLMTDLKVFGVMLLVISIYNIEKAYKNESKSYVISAIEFAVLAISTIMIIYINVIMPSKIVPIIVLLAFAFAIYYTIKATVIYLKSKKKYYMETMKEIIKK